MPGRVISSLSDSGAEICVIKSALLNGVDDSNSDLIFTMKVIRLVVIWSLDQSSSIRPDQRKQSSV
jgi:hypothetical protein